MRWQFEPDPITAPGPHRVTLCDNDNRPIAAGHGEDDAAALHDLYTTLRDQGQHDLARQTIQKYAVVHRSQRGREPDWNGSIPRCPECGAQGDTHHSAACLDRWVHSAFLEQVLPENGEVPAYSTVHDYNTDTMTEHRRWPRNWCAFMPSVRWAVGERIADTAARIVAEADSFPLAICRAAVCVPEWGDNALEIRVPFRR